jgi:ferredoxin
LQLAPGLFDIGAGDVAVTLDDGMNGGIDGDRLAQAEQAARQCPTQAIRISTG